MKTEAQLVRTEKELAAIDKALNTMRYLNYNPQWDTWKHYCKSFNDRLSEELQCYFPQER